MIQTCLCILVHYEHECLCILFTKLHHFVIVIEIRLDVEEVYSLESLLSLLLKHEKTLNKKLVISTPKEHYVVLRKTNTHFKKNLKNKMKSSHAPKNDFKKGGNKK